MLYSPISLSSPPAGEASVFMSIYLLRRKDPETEQKQQTLLLPRSRRQPNTDQRLNYGLFSTERFQMSYINMNLFTVVF